jgi:hypothetical protein
LIRLHSSVSIALLFAKRFSSKGHFARGPKGMQPAKVKDTQFTGEALGGSTLEQRLRCPQCQMPVAADQSRDAGGTVCPSCGAAFNLVDRDATVLVAGQPVTLGHYQLLSVLGRGAFGIVWKAHDAKLDRIVAVKIPRKGRLTPAETEKFLREARAAAQLQHPNIVRCLEVGCEGEQPYLVHEFVNGITLTDLLSGRRLRARSRISYRKCY